MNCKGCAAHPTEPKQTPMLVRFPGAHPVCPECDRIKCPGCKRPLIEGTETICPRCSKEIPKPGAKAA